MKPTHCIFHEMYAIWKADFLSLLLGDLPKNLKDDKTTPPAPEAKRGAKKRP